MQKPRGRGIVIMLDHCKINRAQQSCNNVASSEHGAPHRSCCSLTRMSRPATGKKTPGELSAGDRERNPSKQFRDCFLRSQHSATIYPEQFWEQWIMDRARGPDRAAAAIVVSSRPPTVEAAGEADTWALSSSSIVAVVNDAHWLADPRALLGSRATAPGPC